MSNDDEDDEIGNEESESDSGVDDDLEGAEDSSGSLVDLITVKSVRRWIGNVAKLEKNVERLVKQNRELKKDIRKLQDTQLRQQTQIETMLMLLRKD